MHWTPRNIYISLKKIKWPSNTKQRRLGRGEKKRLDTFLDMREKEKDVRDTQVSLKVIMYLWITLFEW
jgi:hypothetical protein